MADLENNQEKHPTFNDSFLKKDPLDSRAEEPFKKQEQAINKRPNNINFLQGEAEKKSILLDTIVAQTNTSFFVCLPNGRVIEGIGPLTIELGIVSSSDNHIDQIFSRWPDILSTIQYALLELKKQETIFKFEKKYIRLSIFPVVQNGNKVHQLVGSLTDITEQKVNEIRKELKIQQLTTFNNDLEQFAYVASHDLHEPLRMVRNFVQLLEYEHQDVLSEEGLSYIQFAVDGVARMQKLIDDLLRYNRVGKPNIVFREANVENMLYLQQYNLSALIEEKQAKFEILPIPESIICEVKQLGIVFYELIQNALFFNTNEKPLVQISGKATETGWVFSIKDNGPGIKTNDPNEVFGVFRRINARPDAQHTGIGLAICKKIISRHNGNLWYESIVGQGTTFHFSIQKPTDF